MSSSFMLTGWHRAFENHSFQAAMCKREGWDSDAKKEQEMADKCKKKLNEKLIIVVKV